MDRVNAVDTAARQLGPGGSSSRGWRVLGAALALALTPTAALAEEEAATDENLAVQLANPVSNLISVPFQSNWDFGMGPNGDGHRYTLNVQPVIPISLNDDWNIISRTIVPIIDQQGVTGIGQGQTGLGDTVQSLFFSPKRPTSGGIIWGAGPAILLPTATNAALGTGKLGMGPSAVALTQKGPWTIGILGNHIWSVAGKDSRADVSATFVNPFVSYVTKTFTTFSVVPEITYDWQNKVWLAPVNVGVSQLLRVGGQPMSFGLLGRYYLTSPQGGPDWGIRFSVVLLFPKR